MSLYGIYQLCNGKIPRAKHGCLCGKNVLCISAMGKIYLSEWQNILLYISFVMLKILGNTCLSDWPKYITVNQFVMVKHLAQTCLSEGHKHIIMYQFCDGKTSWAKHFCLVGRNISLCISFVMVKYIGQNIFVWVAQIYYYVSVLW